MENVKSQYRTDEILEWDRHLVHSFADLNALEQPEARTVIAEADGHLSATRNTKAAKHGICRDSMHAPVTL